MEQLETDDKLLEDSKARKPKDSSSARYLLIGICCLIVLFAICLLIKVIKNPSKGGGKKIYLFILLYR